MPGDGLDHPEELPGGLLPPCVMVFRTSSSLDACISFSLWLMASIRSGKRVSSHLRTRQVVGRCHASTHSTRCLPKPWSTIVSNSCSSRRWLSSSGASTAFLTPSTTGSASDSARLPAPVMLSS